MTTWCALHAVYMTRNKGKCEICTLGENGSWLYDVRRSGFVRWAANVEFLVGGVRVCVWVCVDDMGFLIPFKLRQCTTSESCALVQTPPGRISHRFGERKLCLVCSVQSFLFAEESFMVSMSRMCVSTACVWNVHTSTFTCIFCTHNSQGMAWTHIHTHTHHTTHMQKRSTLWCLQN